MSNSGEQLSSGVLYSGTSITGDLSSVTDSNVYTMTLQAGFIYRFDLEGAPTGKGSLDVPHISVGGPGGGSGTSRGPGTDANFSITPAVSGTYYVTVSSFGRDGGSYTLTTSPQDDYSDGVDTTGTLAIGGTATGDIEAKGDVDLFRISLEGGVHYRFDLAGASTTGKGTLDLLHVSVNGPAKGGKGATSDGPGTDADLYYPAPVTGMYYLSASSSGGTGSYTLTAAVALPCFATGTLIASGCGAVAVEALQAGDLALTGEGVLRPIIWIGHRCVDCRRHPEPSKVWPVRVGAGAIGEGLPCRDLWLSPDHALFLDGVLIPVKRLINGTTIRQVEVEAVAYWHVALEQHDILLAEGLPVESYLDTGDRSAFENGGGPVRLHPDFTTLTWEAEGCAPLIVTGPVLTTVKDRLQARGGSLATPVGIVPSGVMGLRGSQARHPSRAAGRVIGQPAARRTPRWLSSVPLKTVRPQS